MKCFKLLAATGTILAASQAFCGGLFAPFSMDSANVMPKGVRSFRVAGFSTEIFDKYGGPDDIQPLASKFNKQVTWRELVDSQPAGFDRGEFKGGLESLGINLDSAAGDSRGIINTRVTSTVPVFAWGVTEKLTVGVGVPILYTNLNVSTGWAANSDFQNKLAMLSQKGYYNQVLSYQDKLMNVVAEKITSKGYQMPVDEKNTEMGDVTVAAKYQAYKSPELAVAVAPKVVLPTGRKADVNKVVDLAPGDGQVDVGVGAVVDYSPTAKLAFTSAAGYTYQVASTKAKRIPTSSEESLSADIDSNTREKLGDVMSASLAARYKLHQLWTAGAGYSFQYKQADSYEGGAYDSSRYAYLADLTEQNMHTAQVGLTYSTIPLFQAQKFALPLEASVNFSSVLAGRNVNKIDLTSVELAAYF